MRRLYKHKPIPDTYQAKLNEMGMTSHYCLADKAELSESQIVIAVEHVPLPEESKEFDSERYPTGGHCSFRKAVCLKGEATLNTNSDYLGIKVFPRSRGVQLTPEQVSRINREHLVARDFYQLLHGDTAHFFYRDQKKRLPTGKEEKVEKWYEIVPYYGKDIQLLIDTPEFEDIDSEGYFERIFIIIAQVAIQLDKLVASKVFYSDLKIENTAFDGKKARIIDGGSTLRLNEPFPSFAKITHRVQSYRLACKFWQAKQNQATCTAELTSPLLRQTWLAFCFALLFNADAGLVYQAENIDTGLLKAGNPKARPVLGSAQKELKFLLRLLLPIERDKPGLSWLAFIAGLYQILSHYNLVHDIRSPNLAEKYRDLKIIRSIVLHPEYSDMMNEFTYIKHVRKGRRHCLDWTFHQHFMSVPESQVKNFRKILWGQGDLSRFQLWSKTDAQSKPSRNRSAEQGRQPDFFAISSQSVGTSVSDDRKPNKLTAKSPLLNSPAPSQNKKCCVLF